jgi:hypothetical protein
VKNEFYKFLVLLDSKKVFSQEYFTFLILIIFAIFLNTIKDIILKYLKNITTKPINV